MSLSGEYTVAPRRGPRYWWRRGGREMDGKCRTEPPALPLSEVHQEGSNLVWCRKFHDSIKFNMLQEHNLLPQIHSKENWKNSAKEDRFILQKMFVQEIVQWIWKLLLPHSIINYILFKVAVWSITSSFSGLVLYFGFQHFVFYSAESRTGSGGTKRTSSAGSTGRGGK